MNNGTNNLPPPDKSSSEGLRQRGSLQVFPLVFRSDTQTAHEIRDGKPTKAFYLRFGLLHDIPEAIK